jgi:outer membrane receptor for Fe3+-dicitrate
MTTIRHAMIFTSLTTILTVSIILSHVSYDSAAIPQQYQNKNFTFGPISSIQNGEKGKPEWIITGHWKTNLLSENASKSVADNTTTSPFARSPFDTQIEMVRLNGTAGHTHTITNFVLTNMSQPNNMTKVFNGTSTASMREGPVTDIPTTIRIMGDKVISIWLDPSKIENHYGNTSIYGVVADIEKPRLSPGGAMASK